MKRGERISQLKRRLGELEELEREEQRKARNERTAAIMTKWKVPDDASPGDKVAALLLDSYFSAHPEKWAELEALNEQISPEHIPRD